MTIAVDMGRKATKTKQKLGCLMDYSLDCLGHLTKMGMVKTKFVPLKAVVDLDLF